MRKLFRLLWWALLLIALLLPVAGALALWLAVDEQPLVTETAAVSHTDIARALQLLQRNDPRGALPGITRAVLLSQRDLELLLNHAGRRLANGGSTGSSDGAGGTAGARLADIRARVRLQPGLALVQASLPLPANPLGGWLNVVAVLRQTDELPRVERLRLGRLPVPGWLAEAALPRLLNALGLRAQGELAQRLVSRVMFGPQQLVLAYAWPDKAQQELSNTLVSPDDQARLQVYAERLALLSAELAPPGAAAKPVSMARLLGPVFTLARQRSPDAATAVRENRAALVALAFLVNGRGLGVLLPAARQWPTARPLAITLAGRGDTPQHFLVSAALAAEGGNPLADAIGLYKEVADSRGGSGFSFNDLAADRAGTRFGQRAARDALALQAALAAGVQEADLLPPIADLPESMTERDFKRRFGGVGEPPYRQVLADIEARLDRLPLLGPAR